MELTAYIQHIDNNFNVICAYWTHIFGYFGNPD